MARRGSCPVKERPNDIKKVRRLRSLFRGVSKKRPWRKSLRGIRAWEPEMETGAVDLLAGGHEFLTRQIESKHRREGSKRTW